MAGLVMKRIILFFLIASILTPTLIGNAQTDITTIDTLLINIWPDYDKASVLVLLTGTLPDDTRLPARVTLPLPEAAQLNAIARIDGRDGGMKKDIVSNPGPGTLTFITPDLRFRMEYYFPYTAKDKERSFDYVWLADISVDKLQLKVQKPTSAISLRTVPRTVDVAWEDDEFSYHTFPVKAVPAGQRLSLHVEYTLTAVQFSKESLPASDTGAQTSGAPPKSVAGMGISWPAVAIVAGGIIIVLALGWLLAARRPSSAPPGSEHTQDGKQSRSNFCSHCGGPVGKKHRYCSQCGNPL